MNRYYFDTNILVFLLEERIAEKCYMLFFLKMLHENLVITVVINHRLFSPFK